MKPIRNTLTVRVGMLKLYREEVDQLVGFFRDGCQSFVILNDQHSFDDLDDMKKNVGARIKTFSIRGENPGIAFAFNQSEVISHAKTPTTVIFNELRTTEISDAADALFYKIKDFLQARQQRSVRPGYLVGAAAIFVLMFFGMSRYVVVDPSGQDKLTPPALLILLGGVLVIVIVVAFGVGIRNYMSLETKQNSPGFFLKYREEFSKSAVLTVISSVLSGLIGYFIGHYLK